MKLRLCLILAALALPVHQPTLALAAQGNAVAAAQGQRWSAADANAWYGRQAWLTGASPGYADYALFSIYQWARIVSPLDLLGDDPVMRAWFERLLDLHDGFARATPVYR